MAKYEWSEETTIKTRRSGRAWGGNSCFPVAAEDQLLDIVEELEMVITRRGYITTHH